MRNAVSLNPKPGRRGLAEQPDHQVDAIDVVAPVGLPIDAAQLLRQAGMQRIGQVVEALDRLLVHEFAGTRL